MTLVLEIEHLLGVAFAARGPDNPDPDWPPQPDRVFSALVAAWGARRERNEERQALEWLEMQAAPRIITSDAYSRTPHTAYVPPNDYEIPGGRLDAVRWYRDFLSKGITPPEKGGHKKLWLEAWSVMPDQRKRSGLKERNFPAARPHDPVVHLLWPDALPDDATLAALNALAADTAYVGHSASLTRCRFRNDLDLDPASAGPVRQCVYRGRLAELERDFHARPVRRPSPGAQVRAGREQAKEAIAGIFATDWLVLEHVDGEMPDIRAAALVAKELRNAVMSGYRKAEVGDAIPAAVSGHTPSGGPTSDPHLAIAPLAFLGSPYASGAVLGFALVPPRSSDLLEDHVFRRAMLAISRVDEEAGRRVVRVYSAALDLIFAFGSELQRRSLDPAPYVGEGRVWASCTPIVLDRHLKEKGNAARQQEIDNLIRRACANVGLPEPSSISTGKHSALEGAPSAYPSGSAPSWTRWRLPESLASRPLIHAVVELRPGHSRRRALRRARPVPPPASRPRLTMMPALSPGDFAAFFEAVHAVPPFPWQDRLLRLLAEGGAWPEILDLPTSSGKTAALDIAVFHLAMEADEGAERKAPVRIALVVDRRLIVDDAYHRAKRIEDALADAAQNADAPEIVRRVAERLGSLAEHPERPLLARRLRGGVPREDDWAHTPSQPTILSSTVDQVGSRLLFRGYGISDRMKPVHAGLLGSDCLILLDEAHLAEPFRQTLAAIRKLRPKTEQAAPWQVALLSATPDVTPQPPFSLGSDDHNHPVLARRLAAAKPAALIDIPGRQGVSAEDRRLEEIVSRTKQALAKLRETVPSPAVGVIVNRVARARAVFRRLEDDAADANIVLLIGPARAIEREEAASRDLQPIRTGEGRALDRPLVVVATQTIEAGVDIDFDGLITEAAAFDALRQRFGRLNRAGRAIEPVAAILAHKDDIGSRADDAVYGDRLRKTWEAMITASAGSPEPCVDFGYTRLPRELAERSGELAAEKADAPILLPAYVDLWSQTWPIPNADPAVSLFLHGSERAPASVQIVWRADLNAGDLNDRERIAALLELVPPRAGEAIEIPLWLARAWLRELRNLQANLADVAERAPDEPGGQLGKRVFRYAGSDSERTRWAFADELRNGDLIIVPASYGGCDQWGWAPDSMQAVLDLAETAALPFAARWFAVRVTPELILQWLVREAQEREGEAADVSELAPPDFTGVLAEHRDDAISDLLDAVLNLQPLPGKIRRWLELLKYRRGRLERDFAYGEDSDGRLCGVVFVAPRGIQERALREVLGGGAALDEAAPPVTEDDWLGSTPGYPQPLANHSCEVRSLARAFARGTGLTEALAVDIALAAYLHDAGKADPRFQTMLYGGAWFAADETTVLAKSARRGSRGAWEKAGLPQHWRHEALSVRIAREHPLFEDAHDKELVLWLIGVHHGYGRPLFPHADPCDERDRDLPHIEGERFRLEKGAGPQSLAFSFDGGDWVQIFERLKRRYGVWELARMEAIVRLADHRASEAAGLRTAQDVAE